MAKVNGGQKAFHGISRFNKSKIYKDEVGSTITNDTSLTLDTEVSSYEMPSIYKGTTIKWLTPAQLKYPSHKFLVNGLSFNGWLKLIIVTYIRLSDTKYIISTLFLTVYELINRLLCQIDSNSL